VAELARETSRDQNQKILSPFERPTLPGLFSLELAAQKPGQFENWK